MVLDGINWGMVQNDVTYTAGVRNVVFRDIFLEKPRIASRCISTTTITAAPTIRAPPSRGREPLFDNIRVLS